MPKIIIVSNRLPLKIEKDDEGELHFKTSEGGLATGLGSIYKEGGNIWIGWPGAEIKAKDIKQKVVNRLSKENMRPVFLSQGEIELYYEGFSNETLWPAFHYFNQYVVYKNEYWEAYKETNKKFADAIVKNARKDDIIWVHDYQLLLVPGMVRERLPNINIGFFQHIPFPSYEVFRLLPWRREILEGMLGADLLGFHTYDDMRHFLSSVNRLAFLSNYHGEIQLDGRKVVVDSFPMGIDYEKYHDSAASPDTLKREKQYRDSIGAHKLMLSIDRLDYSKGIPARLKAFDAFLEEYPEYNEKLSLIMIVVPSRDTVEMYRDLKEEIDELVGRINGKYGTIDWTPIHYFYRSFPMEDLSAFYRMADVALVTPMRDGMNLVCKEFVASKHNGRGVLVLSEMAGASKELSDAIIINPNDEKQLINAIHRALNMSEEEQSEHLRIMQSTIKKFNIHHWVNLFMSRLNKLSEEHHITTVALDNRSTKNILKKYKKATNRMLLLDYDGTLVPYADDPQGAKPDNELTALLKGLSSLKNTKVVIISGRDKETLERWLKDLDVDMIGEHGVWYKVKDGRWKTLDTLSADWKAEIIPVLQSYTDRTPGSLIEEKSYSLAWHYRKVETGLGELRAREIISHLKYIAQNMNLQVLEGDKVVEVKNVEVNKGRAAYRWSMRYPADFIFAAGDDTTDEDIFLKLPEETFTVKVGSKPTAARYRLKNHHQMRDFLKSFLQVESVKA
jgi:trehalose 6-phosphate synthase/phosphatase